jgi:predicted lipoprotein
MIRKVFLPALVLLSFTGVANGAYDAAAYRRLNDALVAEHIVPRYERFALAAARLAMLAKDVCAMPSSGGIADLRKAALAAQDAWQAVQHIRFGPVEQEMRATRLAFWPDVRNRTERELSELLHARDKSVLSAEKFPKTSVVLQGFPALERLLFGKDAARALGDGTVDAHYRCAVTHALAANIAAMAVEIHNEWSKGDTAFSRTVASAGTEFALYPKAEEATLDLFKSLHGAIEVVADHKLARPMGETADRAIPSRAEAWRSGRSMENIRANLAAAQAMYLGEDGSGQSGFSRFVREVAKDAELDDLLRRAFAQTLETAQSVEAPLAKAVGDPKERAKLETLRKETQALKAILAQRLTAALAIPLGFNALDGD